METLIRPVIAFTILLALLMSRRVGLGYALIIGATTLGLVTLPINEFLQLLVDTVTAPSTLELVAASFLVLMTGLIYRETGWLNHMAGSLEALIPNPKVILMVIPAIFGLLPVPGGALLSAPFVDEEGNSTPWRSDGSVRGTVITFSMPMRETKG